MALVGRCAAQKLSEQFAAFVAQNPKHADLKFEVTWIRKDEQVFSNPSDFRNNGLRIQLWLGEQFWKNEQAISAPLQTTRTITEYRTQGAEIKQKKMIVTCCQILGVAALAFAALTIIPRHHHWQPS